MDLTVKRLQAGAGSAPNYHLLDAQGNVLLVADQSIAANLDERRQVRLARPDGRLLATIDLPLASSKTESADYAIIHDYAVYAILSVHPPEGEERQPAGPYFTLEVEGERWAALPDPTLAHCYALYDEVPRGLTPYGSLADLDLPPAIGRICRLDADVAFTATLDVARLQQPDLIILALAYLIDRAQPA
ncbi:MAG: hypothetical protein RRC07_14100 [Anaerolineae bacterium]|nr:hypothetical protein [Anaerolineae bacterium]